MTNNATHIKVIDKNWKWLWCVLNIRFKDLWNFLNRDFKTEHLRVNNKLYDNCMDDAVLSGVKEANPIKYTHIIDQTPV